MKIFKRMIVAIVLCVCCFNVSAEAAVSGSYYSFTLQAKGGYGGTSSAVTKQTSYAYAQVYVNSYTKSYKGYYTRVFTDRTQNQGQRSAEKRISGTGKFNVYYYVAGTGVHYGEKHVLKMVTERNNPNKTTVSGTWTP